MYVINWNWKISLYCVLEFFLKLSIDCEILELHTIFAPWQISLTDDSAPWAQHILLYSTVHHSASQDNKVPTCLYWNNASTGILSGILLDRPEDTAKAFGIC